MEKQCFQLWKLFINQPTLWDGWAHSSTPIGFHDHESAVLFGHPNPTKGFLEKEREGVKYYVANPKPATFTANTAVDLNGIPTATIMWQKREQEAMLALISHEAFHAHQMAAGCPFGSIGAAMKYPVNDPEVQALADIEAELLFSALNAEGVTVVTDALNARAARQQLLSGEVAIFENEVELGEGLATYIEIKSAGKDSIQWKSRIQLLRGLNKDAWGADRLRFYYSGMAWALLCDRYADSWQTKGWRPQAELVAKAIKHCPDPNTRVFSGFEFSSVLARHEKEAEERERQMQETLTNAMPGTEIRVEIKIRGNPIGGGWNPNTAVTYPGVGRFYPTGLMYIYDTGTELYIGRNCIERENCTIVFERGNLDIRLNGETITEGSHLGSLSISGNDSKVKLSRARVNYSAAFLSAEELLY